MESSENDSTISVGSEKQPEKLSPGRQRGNRPEPGSKPPSCFTCRRRKVKCDKKHPCENCVKMGITCTFPTGSTRKLLPPSPELLRTLQMLEKAAKTLESTSRQKSAEHVSQPLNPQRVTVVDGAVNEVTLNLRDTELLPHLQDMGATRSDPDEPPIPSIKLSSPSGGKLIQDQGRETYLKASFWDAFNLNTTNGSSSDSEDEMEVDAVNNENEQVPDYSFILGLEMCPTNIKSLRPSRQARIRLWDIFKANVEPLTKILHMPTLEPQIVDALGQDEFPPGPTELLCFCVYFGAVTSLSNQDCESIFVEERSTLCSRFRLGVERLLSACRLASTDDLRVLQAFVLYLVLLKSHHAEISWRLTGLATRLGYSLGLHREGDFGLSIFVTEMRRRLWWQIIILEAPASEDHSSESTSLEVSSFTTSLPRNVDEADLYPEMIQPVADREKFTGMTFFLLRCEVTDMMRTMADERRQCANMSKSFCEMTLQERDTWIQSCEQYLTHRYIEHCSPTDALQWVTSLLASILMRKVRLQIHNPLRRYNMLTLEDRERLFHIAVETIEMTYKLRTDPRIQNWHWFFSSYNQWHALAYSIYYLCLHPLGKKANRGWRAVEMTVVLRWNAMSSGIRRESHQWRHIMRMLDRAKLEKRQAIQNLRARQRNTPSQLSFTGLTTAQGAEVVVQDRAPESVEALSARPPDSGLQVSNEYQLRVDDANPFLDLEQSLVDTNQLSAFEMSQHSFGLTGDAEVDIDTFMGYRYEF